MRRVPILLVALLVATVSSLALAREWTSRSGTYTVEAELVDAGSDYAVLKRSDTGRLVRIPLAQLSLADVEYVQEALKSAGTATGTEKTEKNPFAPAESEKSSIPSKDAPGTRSPPVPRSTAKGPKLAVEGTLEWQVQPDRDSKASASSLPNIKISVPARHQDDSILFAGQSNRFVAVGTNDRNSSFREMWDLRQRKVVGAIREPIPMADQFAVSPDGQRLACAIGGSPRRIEIWSFKTGKREREIPLELPTILLFGLDFAGPDRLVGSSISENAILIWDVASGTRVRKLDFVRALQHHEYAISPGGNYLAVAQEGRFDIFDLRNGVLAGDVSLRGTKSGGGFTQLKSIEFSPDGTELAVLCENALKHSFCCWSMNDGQLVADHQLSDDFPGRFVPNQKARQEIIQWIPKDRGWVLLGVAVVDRKKGGPIWIDKDQDSRSRPKICRMLDENRILSVSGERRDSQFLQTSELPWKTITASAEVLDKGGTLADVGLPPVATPDLSKLDKLHFGSESLAYTPTGASELQAPAGLVIGTSVGVIHTTVSAAGNRYLFLVNGEAGPKHPRYADRAFQKSKPITEVFNLKTGACVSKFEAPARVEFQDLSPSGKFGLFLEGDKKSRVDVFDLETGRQVIGLRPFADEQVQWAVFVDDGHLLTLNARRMLRLWKIDGCVARYELQLNSLSRPCFNRNRSCLAVPEDNSVRLIEPLSGQTYGLLTCPDSKLTYLMNEAAFRQDGRRLAALMMQDRAWRLVVWNLESKEMLCDMELPYRAFHIRWTDPDHVAFLNMQMQPANQIERGHLKYTVVNVTLPRVDWHYQLGLGAITAADGPDDRFWYLVGGEDRKRLLGAPWPDLKASEILAAAPPPAPVYGRDKSVAISVKIGAMPDGLEDRREREDDLSRELEQHFTEALKERGLRVEPAAKVTLKVSVKNLTKEEIVVIRSRYQLLAPARALVLSASSVWARISLESDDNTTLWMDEKFVSAADISSPRVLKDVPLSTSIHYGQWQQARHWCLEVSLPTTLYHPNIHNGAGESVLEPTGPRIIHRYVQKALKSANATTEKNPFTPTDSSTPTTKEALDKAVPSSSSPTKKEMSKKEASSSPRTPKKGKGPKLAVKGKSKWQVQPDPDPNASNESALQEIHIQVPKLHGDDALIFAGRGSHLIALGPGSSDSTREMWDLREKKRVGAIREPIPDADRIAVSPDGAKLAASINGSPAKIEIWSFESGAREREIRLEQPTFSLDGLDFAGPDHIIGASSGENGLIVWDVRSGARLRKLDVSRGLEQSEYAISPGGSYVAVPQEGRFDIFDLRNGVLAGEVNLGSDKGPNTPRLKAIEFSPDGMELAVLFQQSPKYSFYCWSMKDGKLVSAHQLSDDFKGIATPSSKWRTEVIQWVPRARGWMLLGVALVDRKKGGPVWIETDKSGFIQPKICRVLDENRILSVRDGHLETSSLPWETVAETARVVETGGSLADVGRPPIAKPDFSKMKRLPLGHDPLPYKPVVSSQLSATPAPTGLMIGPSMGRRINKTLSAAANPHLFLVNGDPDDTHPKYKVDDFRQAMPITEVFDLKTGARAYRFEAPDRMQFQDFSPSGKFGLFLEVDRDTRTRLDVFDLETGRHIVAFRPFTDDQDTSHHRVKWAAFASDGHLVSMNSRGRFRAWKIEGCKPLYELSFTNISHPFFNRDRSCLAMGEHNLVRLIEPLSGRSCGILTCPETQMISLVRNAAFRQDGQRFAALLHQVQGERLVVWDPETKKLLCDMQLPCQTRAIRWTDPDHIAFENVEPPNQIEYFQETVVNVSLPRVAWQYRIPRNLGRTIVANGSDDRFWYLSSSEGSNTRKLLAVSLPDPKAAEHLAATPPPQPILGPDQSVALSVKVGAMPDGLEDRRKREDTLIRDLQNHFTKALKERGVRVEPTAKTTLNVSVKNLTNDEILLIRSRYQRFGPVVVVFSISTVWASISLETDDKITAWSGEKFVSATDVKAPQSLNNGSLGTSIHYGQWQLARQWCLDLPLPINVYHPDALQGAGDSLLEPAGPRIIQKHGTGGPSNSVER